jgi:hypothetical protein
LKQVQRGVLGSPNAQELCGALNWLAPGNLCCLYPLGRDDCAQWLKSALFCTVRAVGGKTLRLERDQFGKYFAFKKIWWT